MLTGRQALRTIRRRVERAKKDYDQISDYVRELEELHGSALQEEREVLTELAQTYLPELTHDAMVKGLTQLKLRVAEVLQRRDQRKEALQGGIDRHLTRLAEAECALAAEKAGENAVGERVAAGRTALAAALDQDPEYRERAEEHAGLMDRRDQLKARRARLLAVASSERPAYEGFAPFRYLKDRAFGEPEYRAGWITRLLDRWLARRIDFPTLYRNHRLLQIGPHQIQAEILRSSRRAGDLEGAMDEREQRAAVEEGLPETLEELAAALEDVAKAREVRDATRVEYEGREGELRAIEAHRGQYYEEALELHRQHLGAKSIRELEALARETAGGEDDRLVRRLDDVRSRLDRIVKRGRERLEEFNAAREKVDGLLQIEEGARRDFGSFRSHFHEGFALDSLLEGFMVGRMSWEAVLGYMNDAHFKRETWGSIAESMLGGILSELAASFERPSSEDADLTVTTFVFRDAQGRESRRVTRRRPASESRRER